MAYFNFGMASLEIGQAMDSGRSFRIASVTKIFTATAILQLVDQNKVGLDDTLDQWMPGQVAGGNQVTVHDLLDMHSGLDYYENSPTMLELSQTEPLHQYTPAELLSYANRQISPPRQAFDYNNLNYVLLEAIIIEKATGIEAIQDTICSSLPLGPTHASRRPTTTAYPASMPTATTRWLHRCLPTATALPWLPTTPPSSPPPCFEGAGNMISTAEDMLTWLDALLDGKALSPAMHQAQLATIAMGSDPNMSYKWPGRGRL